jgi:hypothetical protein
MLVRQATTRAAVLPSFVRGTVTGLLPRSSVALASRTLATLPSDASTEAKPNRPLSPHVSIYRFPLPALTSITNRATGSGLTAGKPPPHQIAPNYSLAQIPCSIS